MDEYSNSTDDPSLMSQYTTILGAISMSVDISGLQKNLGRPRILEIAVNDFERTNKGAQISGSDQA
jgi:hypothetical protein